MIEPRNRARHPPMERGVFPSRQEADASGRRAPLAAGRRPVGIGRIFRRSAVRCAA